MSQITTHILDTTRGQPAPDVPIVLYARQADSWQELARGITNPDGRVPNLLPPEQLLPLGTYKLTFQTQQYFDQQATATFYPFVEIVFTVSSPEHYHVPLLLNPFGYATYRGS